MQPAKVIRFFIVLFFSIVLIILFNLNYVNKNKILLEQERYKNEQFNIPIDHVNDIGGLCYESTRDCPSE